LFTNSSKDSMEKKNINNHISDSKLASYIDGTLNSKEREEVTLHLAKCQECRYVLMESHLDKKEYELSRKSINIPFKSISLTLIASLLIIVIISSTHYYENDNETTYAYKSIKVNEESWFDDFLEKIKSKIKKLIGDLNEK